MKISTRYARPLIAAVTIVGASTAWHASMPTAEEAHKVGTAPQQPLPAAALPASGASGVAGNMYFVDEHGNPRTPTAAEMRTLADALKRDLARIAGPHRGKRYERTLPGGAVAATVATSDLVFLVAGENGDGTVSIRHSATGDAIVAPEAAATAPEM